MNYTSISPVTISPVTISPVSISPVSISPIPSASPYPANLNLSSVMNSSSFDQLLTPMMTSSNTPNGYQVLGSFVDAWKLFVPGCPHVYTIPGPWSKWCSSPTPYNVSECLYMGKDRVDILTNNEKRHTYPGPWIVFMWPFQVYIKSMIIEGSHELKAQDQKLIGSSLPIHPRLIGISSISSLSYSMPHPDTQHIDVLYVTNDDCQDIHFQSGNQITTQRQGGNFGYGFTAMTFTVERIQGPFQAVILSMPMTTINSEGIKLSSIVFKGQSPPLPSFLTMNNGCSRSNM